MQCVNCNNAITSGMEISLPRGGDELHHCPHCLQILPTRADDDSQPGQPDEANVSVGRFERRRRARERFVDGLLEASTGGGLLCPDCNGKLNTNDELALRSGEQFCCPHCRSDLAEQAYRKVAYAESRWLPVIAVLSDVAPEPACTDCAYLGAVAHACQVALSHMARPHPDECKLVEQLLARSTWRVPECDWPNCSVVKEYRKLAAEGIDLL